MANKGQRHLKAITAAECKCIRRKQVTGLATTLTFVSTICDLVYRVVLGFIKEKMTGVRTISGCVDSLDRVLVKMAREQPPVFPWPGA